MLESNLSLGGPIHLVQSGGQTPAHLAQSAGHLGQSGGHLVQSGSHLIQFGSFSSQLGSQWHWLHFGPHVSQFLLSPSPGLLGLLGLSPSFSDLL